jgi:hypothetical protein
MNRTYKVNGETLTMTDKENAARDAEEAAHAAAKPMNDWQEAMGMSDGTLPRYVEDILDGMADKSSVPQITLDKLQAKKDLRATKP